MRTLTIDEQDGFPRVILDKEKEIFHFSGKSLPENARNFYGKIVEWFDEYAKNPNSRTEIEYRMDYFNTASSKRILDVLEKLEEIYENGNDVVINWYYLDMDLDMLDAGKEYANLISVPFNLIPYSN